MGRWGSIVNYLVNSYVPIFLCVWQKKKALVNLSKEVKEAWRHSSMLSFSDIRLWYWYFSNISYSILQRVSLSLNSWILQLQLSEFQHCRCKKLILGTMWTRSSKASSWCVYLVSSWHGYNLSMMMHKQPAGATHCRHRHIGADHRVGNGAAADWVLTHAEAMRKARTEIDTNVGSLAQQGSWRSWTPWTSHICNACSRRPCGRLRRVSPVIPAHRARGHGGGLHHR